MKSASSVALERPVATSSPVLRVVTCQPQVTGRGRSHAGLQVNLPLPPSPSPLPGQNLRRPRLSCQSISSKPSPRFLSSSICLLLCPARPRHHPLPRRRASRPQWTRGSCSEATASPEGRVGILPLPRISSHIWHLPHGACDLTFSAIAFP